MDEVHVIDLPASARLESAHYPNPNWWVAKCKWRITGGSGKFEIVRATLDRRWPHRSIEGEVDRENGDIWAASFALYLPPGRGHGEQRPPTLRGKVTLIDNRNRRHRFSIIF